MANKSLFERLRGRLLPPADTRNHERAPAYACDARHALAQYAATGCLNGTFYAAAEEQLDTVLRLCERVPAEFIARTAVYSRERGAMKDMPALLCAVLSVKEPKLMEWIFDRVIDNGRMLRTFVQVMRSGVVGRRSLGTLPKRAVRRWLARQHDDALLRAAVGQSPSLADVVKMVHPKPQNESRGAFYAWLLGRDYVETALPESVRHLEAYKRGERATVPSVPFQMLTALDLGTAEWTAIARQAPWQATRMNLNTFARHGVFAADTDARITQLIARRLRDRQAIRAARAFPYQLMVACLSADPAIPAAVKEALHEAMEISVENVPSLGGKAYVCPDVSGSMKSPLTGDRKGATTAVRCVDVASLITASIVRRNPSAEVLPFASGVVELSLNPRDSIVTNTEKLAAIGGGGTNCRAPLALLNKRRAAGDLVVLVSDNQSWIDAAGGRATATMRAWSSFTARNPSAKLVCIDLQPYGTTQAQERGDVLNIGGFSDQVFDLVAAFAQGKLAPSHWIGAIEQVEL